MTDKEKHMSVAIDKQKYINALRKCAGEHDKDKTFTGHIIISDLCRDTANFLEENEVIPKADPNTQDKKCICVREGFEHGDTLYEFFENTWDGRLEFNYVRDIKYCPVCGKLLPYKRY